MPAMGVENIGVNQIELAFLGRKMSKAQRDKFKYVRWGQVLGRVRRLGSAGCCFTVWSEKAWLIK